MSEHVSIRVYAPGGPGQRITSAELVKPDSLEHVEYFTAFDDYCMTLDLGSVPAASYRLSIGIAGHPTLYFGVRVKGAGERSFEFASPQPNCATISLQEMSFGFGVTMRVHAVTFSLPVKHEEVVLVAGVDLAGKTDYRKYAETWRDDLYHGRTDLGDQPNSRIPRAIYDHTVVSIFDFRTGILEQQVKGIKGWHTMRRAMQGKEAPAIERPKAADALERRQKADSISILHVYAHISEIGRSSRGCLRQLHFFSHAYIRGPVLLNTSDSNSDSSEHRDSTDKDPRTKDFKPTNLSAYKNLRDAVTKGTYVKVWGCFGSEMLDKLRAVARTKSPDEAVEVDGEAYTSAEMKEDLRRYTFPESYMIAFCRELGVDGWSAAPGTKSLYKRSGKRYYFYVKQSVHGAVIGWFERNFDCKRDMAGMISFRKLR